MAFSDPAKAILHVKYFGSEEITSTIGLDGISRPSAEGDLRRGYWADLQTFVLELLDIGEQKIHLTFEGDRMILRKRSWDCDWKGEISKKTMSWRNATASFF